MKKIAIFGASPYGRFAKLMLDNSEYQVVIYFDNGKMASERGSLDGIPIDKPDNIKNYELDFVIIAIAQYSEQIRSQLISLGMPNEKIITFIANHEGVQFHHDTRIAQLKLCMEDIKRKRLKGNMAELGVYKGDFAKYMNAVFPEKKLYLFDTFQGFDSKDKNEKDQRDGYENLFKDTDIKVVLEKMINPGNAIPRKGWFPDTLEGMPDDETYCLVSLDTDIYQPMYAGLEYFYPRLEMGGYIFVHDFWNGDWNGIMKSVDDFCKKANIGYVPILDRCGSVIITK